MPRPSKLYLAYGSNLNKSQMRRRCSTARALGTVMLNDAKLVFRGAADAIYSPGDKVPCGVWRLFPDDEAALDRAEGIRSGHYAKEMVELDNGDEALLYVMTSQGICPPSQYYFDTIAQGYRDFGLDLGYLHVALQHSYLEKEHDAWTHARRKRQKEQSYTARLAQLKEGMGK